MTMGDPWGFAGFRGEGEGLQGANRKKKNRKKILKNRENLKKKI